MKSLNVFKENLGGIAGNPIFCKKSFENLNYSIFKNFNM